MLQDIFSGSSWVLLCCPKEFRVLKFLLHIQQLMVLPECTFECLSIFFLVSKHHKSCKGPSWLVVVGRLIMKILRTLFNLYSTYTEQKFTPCPNKLLSPSSHLDPNFALVHLQSTVWSGAPHPVRS